MLDTLSFLCEKFVPASLPEVYAPRRALLANLHETAENGFIYMTAPAGSGKTVTALLWLDDCGREPVWISLDEYDNVLSVFYKLIATGLYATQPDNENMRAILESADFSASPVEYTIALISEMRPDMLKRSLVLDDMHLVTNEEIMNSLPFVIKRLPQSFVTFILSQEDLPEAFDGLIKNGREIIPFELLRFTSNEIHAYYKSLGLTITPEEASTVQTATDGWAIGVNAVAQSGDFSTNQQSGIFAHFFEEHIWNTWDESLRDFCLKTSVVDEFDSELAERLSERADARDVIKMLSHTHSFISRLRDGTYRYHRLFADFLREKLGRDDEQVCALYKTAAHYYMENKDYAMALRFWLDSGDYHGADKFLLRFMYDSQHGDMAGYVDFLRSHFIRDFPKKAFQDSPALHICCAWYYYMTSQYIEYAYHADEGYRNIRRIAQCDPKFVEFAMLMYSMDYRSDMLDKIKRFRAFGKLVKHVSRDGIIRYMVSCTHNLPFAHRSSFDYSEVLCTEKNIEKVRRSVFMILLGDQSEQVLALGLAGICYERNDLEAALSKITLLTAQMTEENSIELRVSAKFLYHSILFKMGRNREAAASLHELTDFVQNAAPFFLTNLEAYKAKFKLLDCDRQAARSWLDKSCAVDAERIDLYLLFQHFTTARAYMALGDEKNAREYVTRLRDFGCHMNRVCDFCEASVLLSALDWAAGNKKEAVVEFESVLERLQHYGYTRMVIDEGASMLPMLKRVAAKTMRPDYSGPLSREFVSELVLETHRFAKRHKGVAAGFAQSVKPVRLSKQQAYMLTLLGKGHSNAMIVEETGLKITTVKTHTAIAYRKLGVNNALDAVIKARDLGLIDSYS